MNASPLEAYAEDPYPVQQGHRFSIRVEFDRALADETGLIVQFEALNGIGCFAIGDRERMSLRLPEYRVHGVAQAEPGVYRVTRITLHHPALASRVLATPPDIRLTIVEASVSFPELVSAQRYIL